MDMELLKRLYMVCSDENGIFEAGFNICELYQRLEEVKEADSGFSAAIDAANLSVPVADSIVVAAIEENLAYELQGFVNGFRLAMRMATGKAVA